jgi:hypothetical protein
MIPKNILDDYAKACKFHEDEAIDIAHHIAQFINPNKEYELKSLETYLLKNEIKKENIMTFTKTEINNIKFKNIKEKLVNEIEGNFEDVAKSKTLQDLYDNLDYLITICNNYLEELDGEINDI